MMKLIYKIENNKYKNIKEVLKGEYELSKRLILKLKTNNKILLNGEPKYVLEKVNINDILEINLDFEEETENIVATKMDLEIIFEDENYIVINKPAKIETHPTCVNYDKTLSNGLKYYFEQINLKKKIRPINRLDKDTSGLIVFAKNEYIQDNLAKQIKNKTFKREYLGLLEGILNESNGIIEEPIKRKEGSILERTVATDGEYALTKYEVIKHFNMKTLESFTNPERLEEPATLVKFNLETGRTHQIRVHTKHIGHPIVGDFLYGKRNKKIDRQALHSYKISFIHPISKEQVEYETELPMDIKKIISGI